MKELDIVVLEKDIDEYGLKVGDIGTIVHSYGKDEAFEVEFISGDGNTVAVVTLNRDEIRPRAAQEILHVREIA